LVLETRDSIWHGIRARFGMLPPGLSVVDDLIAERRAEAAREDAEMGESA
jgi:hypothetical protein